jgi:hypothetical protein
MLWFCWAHVLVKYAANTKRQYVRQLVTLLIAQNGPSIEQLGFMRLFIRFTIFCTIIVLPASAVAPLLGAVVRWCVY